MIELTSDLGGGKTTFVQGLAKGLGYTGSVTSPTFTLANIYQLPNHLELHHYDLYRLNHTGVLADELAEDLGQAHIITIIEWAAVAHEQLPSDRLIINLEVTGDTERQLIFTATGPKANRLIESLKS